jgi:hypothetical protein
LTAVGAQPVNLENSGDSYQVYLMKDAIEGQSRKMSEI